jgi:hypothetical protein
MKKQLILRPIDVLVLLKIISSSNRGVHWNTVILSRELCISQSEVSESLKRCRNSKLVDAEKKEVLRNSLFEFCVHGVKYSFPANPGPLVRGVPTAHSAPPVSDTMSTSEVFVWEDWQGKARGQAIEPLYKTVTKAILQDSLLYELLALIDSIRIGKARERNLAETALENRILNSK